MYQESFETVIVIEPLIIKEAIELEDRFIGFFEGVASTPDVDLEGDKFTLEVLEKNVPNLKGKPILLLHGRDPFLREQPIGEIIDAWIEDGVLKIRAGIYKSFKKIWEYVKRGLLKALSIGGVIKKIKHEDSLNIIEDAEIREVSLTPRGVNQSAAVLKIFGKSFIIEDGILREITIGNKESSMNSRKFFMKIDIDLPIVERDVWDGSEAAERILDWAEKEDGTIDPSKASKLFLKVEGDGSRRRDYSWPVGDVVNGEPVLVTSGIITAIRYASGARGVEAPQEVREALEKLVERLKKEGMLPEDYVVPWRRLDKTDSLVYPIVVDARYLENFRFEKGVDISLRDFGKMSYNFGIEKGLTSREETVRKIDGSGSVDLYKTSLFYKLYRELYNLDSSHVK